MADSNSLLLDPQRRAAGAREELARILSHRLFARGGKLKALLSHLLEAELAGRTLTETELAVISTGDPQNFHPLLHSHVRVDMHRLRAKLAEYYRNNSPGKVRLLLPIGSLRLRIEPVSANNEPWRRTFSQARLLSESRYVDKIDIALSLIDEVLAAKPDFAPAYALKTSCCIWQTVHGDNPVAFHSPARDAAAHAMKHAPDAWESLAAAASVAALLDWNWDLADRLYARAAAIPGNEIVADPWYQLAEVAQNRVGPLLAKMREALSAFPLPPRGMQQNFGFILHLAECFDEAEQELRQTTVLYPDEFGPWMWLAKQALVRGSRAKAAQHFLRTVFVSRGRMPGTYFQLVRNALLTGRIQSPRTAPGGANEFGIVLSSSMLNRPDAAIAALERMLDARNSLGLVLMRAPLQRYLHTNPRFLALFHRAGVPPPSP
jgi:tetratricopeptide (TPR) repeat protein